MRSCNLESQLKYYILIKYGYTYNKELPVETEDNQYLVKFNTGNDYRPILIQGEFDSDEAFLEFMYKEIDSRRLFSVGFSKLEKQLDNIYGEQNLLNQ